MASEIQQSRAASPRLVKDFMEEEDEEIDVVDETDSINDSTETPGTNVIKYFSMDCVTKLHFEISLISKSDCYKICFYPFFPPISCYKSNSFLSTVAFKYF